MEFSPKTEKELEAANLFEPGLYDFEVAQATDEQSSKGNEMIKLTLRVFVGSNERVVFDYLVNTEKAAYKIRHFCDSIGKLLKYEAGTLTAADCVGASGKAHIVITRDKTGEYSDKNTVKDYVRREDFNRADVPTSVFPADLEPPPYIKDDIPF